MTIAQIVSELLYSGKTLAEIAGYTTVFIRKVLLLRRDKYGKLADPENELPPWVHVDANGMRTIPKEQRCSFTNAYKRAKTIQGLSKDDAQKAWEKYLDKEVQLADLIRRTERRKGGK